EQRSAKLGTHGVVPPLIPAAMGRRASQGKTLRRCGSARARRQDTCKMLVRMSGIARGAPEGVRPGATVSPAVPGRGHAGGARLTAVTVVRVFVEPSMGMR